MINNKYTSSCFRCYHNWKRRKENLPKVCPKCKSPYWNKPRKRSPKELIFLIKDLIINMHDAIIRFSGGERGVRDEGGIINSSYKFLNHQGKHKKDPASLGAFILNEFAKRHHFIDGNKRTAYAIAKMFMLINHYHFKPKYSESVKFILEVAKGDSKLGFNEIKKWIIEGGTIIEEKDLGSYLKDVLINLILEMDENGKKSN